MESAADSPHSADMCGVTISACVDVRMEVFLRQSRLSHSPCDPELDGWSSALTLLVLDTNTGCQAQRLHLLF